MGVSQSTTLLQPNKWQACLPLLLNRLSFLASPLLPTVYLSTGQQTISFAGTPQWWLAGGGNGGSSSLISTNQQAITGSGNWTVSVWFLTVPGNVIDALSYGINYGPGAGGSLAIRIDGQTPATTYTMGSSTAFAALTPATEVNVIWQNTGGATCQCFINGVAANPNNISFNATTTNRGVMTIGDQGGTFTATRDLRVFTRAISSAEAASIWNGGVQSYAAGPITGMALWLKMNEGSGGTLSDSSGNNDTWTGNTQWYNAGSASTVEPLGILLGDSLGVTWVSHGELAWQQWYAWWTPGMTQLPQNPLTICEWDSTVHLGDVPYSPNKAPPDFLPATFRVQRPLRPRLKALAPELARWMRSLRS